MSDLFFSICIPTYNSSAVVEDSIISAINQTYKNYELIIVDDHSTDGTTEIINKYAHLPFVSIHINERNIGMTSNWNKCLELAKGKYIAFVHHDDCITPDYLSDAYSILTKNQNIGLLTFESQYERNVSIKGLIKAEDYFNFIFRWEYAAAPSEAIFINLKELHYDPNMHYSPEADLYLQIFQKGYDGYYSTKKNSIRNFGKWDQNISTRLYYKWIIFNDRFEILKKWKNNPLLKKEVIFAGLKNTITTIYQRQARVKALKLKESDNLTERVQKILRESSWFGLNKLEQLGIMIKAYFFYTKKYSSSFISGLIKLK